MDGRRLIEAELVLEVVRLEAVEGDKDSNRVEEVV